MMLFSLDLYFNSSQPTFLLYLLENHLFFGHYEVPVGNAVPGPNQTIDFLHIWYDIKGSLVIKEETGRTEKAGEKINAEEKEMKKKKYVYTRIFVVVKKK